MKWVGIYSLAFSCLTQCLSGSDSLQDNYIKAQKIELLRSEICYARHIAFSTREGWIPHEYGLDWVIEVLDIAKNQLDEIEAND